MSDAFLEFTDHEGRHVIAVTGERFTIGRRAGSELVISRPEVSRDHAEIVRRGENYVLRDRGSRHGTFLNGELITERDLRPGDSIRLGGEGQPEIRFGTGAFGSAGRTALRAADSTTHSAAGELRQVTALLAGLRAVGTGRVLEEVLALVLDSTLEVSGAERGFIMLADAGGRLEFRLGRARGGVTLPGREFETSRRIPEEVFATGSGQLVADMLQQDIAADHPHTIERGIRTVFCVPLRLVRLAEERPERAAHGAETPLAEERRIGVLYLDSQRRSALLSESMRGALEMLATEASMAIENARLYRDSAEKERIERELRVAAEIQQAMLPPRRRRGAGFEAVAASLPCQAIGGDFFDYLDLPGARVGFALGDVSGKGPPAALLASLVQGMLHAQSESETSPAEMLRRVNRGLAARAVSTRFATLACVVLDPDGRVQSAAGGHLPPFLVRGDGSVTMLEKGGLVLGVFPQAVFEEETAQLAPGDTLVLYSDGLSEAWSPEGEEFGEERIERCLRQGCALPPGELLDRLLAEVRAFTRDAPQADDLTVLVVRYEGKEP